MPPAAPAPVPITVAPRDAQPFPVEAVVIEDDTYHALSAEPVFAPSDEHPLRVLNDAHATEPERPGAVVARRGVPLRLLAIVHDLGRDPSWREGWVASAYEGVLYEAERRRLRSIALPALGTVHGRLRRERSRALLDAALDRVRPRWLERIWLVSDPA